MAAAAVLKIPFPVLGIVSFCKYIVINVGLSPVGFLDTTGSGNERVMGGGLPPLVGGGDPLPHPPEWGRISVFLLFFI